MDTGKGKDMDKDMDMGTDWGWGCSRAPQKCSHHSLPGPEQLGTASRMAGGQRAALPPVAQAFATSRLASSLHRCPALAPWGCTTWEYDVEAEEANGQDSSQHKRNQRGGEHCRR